MHFLKKHVKITLMKMNRIIKRVLLERELTAGEVSAKMGISDSRFSQVLKKNTIAPPPTLGRILEALQCHAEIVIVDDVTGERYELD